MKKNQFNELLSILKKIGLNINIVKYNDIEIECTEYYLKDNDIYIILGYDLFFNLKENEYKLINSNEVINYKKITLDDLIKIYFKEFYTSKFFFRYKEDELIHLIQFDIFKYINKIKKNKNIDNIKNINYINKKIVDKYLDNFNNINKTKTNIVKELFKFFIGEI